MVTNPPLTPRFRYARDPACLVALALYLLHRFALRPHGITAPVLTSYLNDLLCLPLFLPNILYLQRLLGLRSHDRPPTGFEILQHWLVFSLVFEVLLPRFPHLFRTTSDPLDVLAYLAGGLLAFLLCWSQPSAGLNSRASKGLDFTRRGMGS